MKSLVKLVVAVLLIGGFAFVPQIDNVQTVKAASADPGGGVRP